LLNKISWATLNKINWATASLAILWLSAAFMVAYPEYVFTFKLGDLVGGFVSGERHENVYIPLLIMIDIIISLRLKHYQTSGKALMVMVISGVTYIVLAAYIFENAASTTPLHSTTIDIVFTLSVLCLFVVRYMSFVSAKPGNPVKDDGTPLAMVPVNTHLDNLKDSNP